MFPNLKNGKIFKFDVKTSTIELTFPILYKK